MATRPSMLPPHNETEHSVSRITREGKQITYKLSVMQQPERARACGAASADRRPVDPPPVVELRIFESEPGNDAHKTDITFAYNANFFLYATLDSARPIAHGRLAGPPSCPVLTGVPVAGVAYLDRPTQAGYFIFPDLSVRHEGRYRLNFHLYEEIKDAKDADKDSTMPIPSQVPRATTNRPGSPQAFLHFRLEVKSVPFTVYSAKKFPGLATSTSLSRVIAEQGCRVRIRRDVRMRRRGDKREDEYDFDGDRSSVYRQSDRYTTPDRYIASSIERPRSNSNHSAMQSPYGFQPDPNRRTSVSDYGFPVPQPYERPMPPAPVPMAPSQTPGYQSHLSFGSTPMSYPAPQMPPTPPPIAASSASLYSPQSSFSHLRQPSATSEYDATTNVIPKEYADGHAGSHATIPDGSNQSPTTKAQQPYMDMQSMEPMQYQPMAQNMIPQAHTPHLAHSLPPLKALSSEYVNQPMQSVESPSSGYDAMSGRRMYYQTGPTSVKRTHEDSFGLDERPMTNGMRPDTDTYSTTSRRIEAQRAALLAELGDEMAYKRANGRTVMKVPPSVI
ncbi:Velvet factor [Penicillium lagena]|uniref:Velvet factor n=1 Tax=Penicillium lagena TaxID=94218 RepID=UPI00254209D9|nr:Velvet factor [Penicillium lagena]KAJ5620078.1 Velvet factor [Penicillium lagena]